MFGVVLRCYSGLLSVGMGLFLGLSRRLLQMSVPLQ